jgi:predicted cobalt transporter CbtA
VILAGIIWFVLFLIPALKYPANPPAVGDLETIYYREGPYIAILAISGFSALGLALAYRRFHLLGSDKSKKIAIVVSIYAAIMITTYVLLPPNPDEIAIPLDLVQEFRVASAFIMSVFWGLLGVIFGLFWDRFKPHETAKIAAT